MEAWTGFGPVNGGFADLCLTTWLPRRLGCLLNIEQMTDFASQFREFFIFCWKLAVISRRLKYDLICAMRSASFRGRRRKDRRSLDRGFRSTHGSRPPKKSPVRAAGTRPWASARGQRRAIPFHWLRNTMAKNRISVGE